MLQLEKFVMRTMRTQKKWLTARYFEKIKEISPDLTSVIGVIKSFATSQIIQLIYLFTFSNLLAIYLPLTTHQDQVH
jgi:hypothetical protein